MLAPQASWADTECTRAEMEIPKTHRESGTEEITSRPKREALSELAGIGALCLVP